MELQTLRSAVRALARGEKPPKSTRGLPGAQRSALTRLRTSANKTGNQLDPAALPTATLAWI
jgi:hypothetical protein